MRAAFVVLSGLAFVFFSCGGDASPTNLPEEPHPGRVVYYRQSPAPRAIVAVSADGSYEEQLFTAGAESGAGVVAADCSPDGKVIAFAVAGYDQIGEYGYTLLAANLDGSNNRELFKGLEADQPAWSPDGRSIAFVQRGESEATNGIWLVDADGSNPRRLTSGPDAQPRWSPDGQQVAFTSTRDGNREIYTVSVRGGDLLNLTSSTAEEVVAGWSPDGLKIIYTTFGDGDIHLMNTASGETESVSIATPEDLIGYGWSPLSPRPSLDGTLLAFTAPVPSGPSVDEVSISATRVSNATVGVYVTNADGTATHRVDSAESAIFLTWCR